MISTNMNAASRVASFAAEPKKSRFPSKGTGPDVLADIYQEETNIAIWRRDLSERLRQAANDFATSNPAFHTAMTVTPENALASISESLGSTGRSELSESITELVDMYCCLFGLKRTGLRLSVLDRAMCPKFHVDRVPCRLVTTYRGVATEWLPHELVDRSKLGPGSNGQSDCESGLFRTPHDIEHLNCGDVALLKGELWEGNENAGLVHRSPAVAAGENRLLLTLDVSS